MSRDSELAREVLATLDDLAEARKAKDHAEVRRLERLLEVLKAERDAR